MKTMKTSSCLSVNVRVRMLICVAILLATSPTRAGWTLVWSDEFNESTINPDNWTYDLGTGSGGWGNNELEYYTSRTNNVRIENGNLVIQARQESYGGMNYTSARLKSQGLQSWTYGRIEASIRLPSGQTQGLWPAFWMLGNNFGSVGWPECGEIDLMERVNLNTTINGTIHWYDNGEADYGSISSVLDFTQYHVYAIEWDPGMITWYVDGNPFLQANITNNINNTGAFHLPFFILLNLAVGGNWPGSPDAATTFPATMYVDYVRVYQNTTNTTPAGFSLSASPASLSVAQGASGVSTIILNQTNLSGSVSLSASGLPSGVSASFNPTPTSGNSTLTLSASSSAATGTFMVTVTGTSGGTTHATSVSLTVTAASTTTIPKTWYLFNTPVSGVSPAGQDLQTNRSGTTGWQPIQLITTNAAYWYSPAVTGTTAAGTWDFYLWSNSPGSPSYIRVDLYQVNASGSGARLIGSQTQNINATGTGNHPSLYPFSASAITFGNQRLLVKITSVSGVNATIAYNSNDFPTRLLTP
jgi:beta-glucanase (GH16 family)